MHGKSEILFALKMLVDFHDYIGEDLEIQSSDEWDAMDKSVAMANARKVLVKYGESKWQDLGKQKQNKQL